MTQNKSRRRTRRRLHRGRTAGCLVVLFVVITLIISLISSCVSKNKPGKDDITQPAIAQTQPVEQTTLPPADDGKFIVCLDPGHGGSDPGSNHGERLEKDDNLRYALAVADELKKRDGINVIMTRINDNIPDNFDSAARGKIANDAGADLFLALHRNCAEDSSGNGVEVWIKKNPPIVDQVLGYQLIKQLQGVGIQSNRHVHAGFRTDEQENFSIMDSIDMSGCLLELGFISNDEDNRLFDVNLKQYAASIADVIEYIYTNYYK